MNPPTVGPTGSKIVSATLFRRSKQADELDGWAGFSPSRPGEHDVPLSYPRKPDPYDIEFVGDDDYAIEIPISKAEFRRRVKLYDREVRAWEREESKRLVAGAPCTYRLKVECEDGIRATAVGDGKDWHWIDVVQITSTQPAERRILKDP